MLVNCLNVSTIGVVLIGTLLELLLITLFFGVCTDIILAAETKRADDGEGHFPHAEQSGHGAEVALEREVHQGRMDDVVLMVAQGNLVTPQLLGEVEELLAALPGAEEAGGLWLKVEGGGWRVDGRGDDVEGDLQTLTEVLQIGSVRLVMDVLHPYMQGLDGEVGYMHLRAARHEFQQTERVLATRQTDEDFIVLINQLVLPQRFVEGLPKSFCYSHLLHENEIDGTDDEQEGQDVVPVQVLSLKHDVGNDGEDRQRDALLNHLQLNQREGASVVNESETVGGHLAAIFQEGDAPREDNNAEKRP